MCARPGADGVLVGIRLEAHADHVKNKHQWASLVGAERVPSTMSEPIDVNFDGCIRSAAY